jgi:hypothetical protein
MAPLPWVLQPDNPNGASFNNSFINPAEWLKSGQTQYYGANAAGLADIRREEPENGGTGSKGKAPTEGCWGGAFLPKGWLLLDSFRGVRKSTYDPR